MSQFNPNNIAQINGNLFGLPRDIDRSELVILGVNWDVTVSYGDGTSQSPDAILEASYQVDLFDLDYGNFWEKGIFYAPCAQEIIDLSSQTRPFAIEKIKLLEKGTPEENALMQSLTEKVNLSTQKLNEWVFSECKKVLDSGKKLILLGGDHSTPLGYLQALSLRNESFGILQIDAHQDLRRAYEGFEFSHASIMYNALKLDSISHLSQVGIRDFCEEELDFARNHTKDIHIYFDRNLKRQKLEGKIWRDIAQEIVSKLPQNIYISFDIDGLDPKYCPNTGTPVLGGLEIDEVFMIFDEIKKQNKTVIGIDLNEVGSDLWDANVGARILYRLSGLFLTQ
ncbi:MAG: agmatinase family protein [Chitinophagales bacterium]|jgi:agmatinase|nr:agmatinase family protein [Chitinophagales bacterium]